MAIKDKEEKMNFNQLINKATEQNTIEFSWGSISWLVNGEMVPNSEQTFGVVTIFSGKRNPLHAHPNCEEILYIVSGECDHKIGDEVYRLKTGDVICIPREVEHWAYCTSSEPLKAIISFSSPYRKTDFFEE
jgi:quercetin dioxygenase-like cupin family protein